MRRFIFFILLAFLLAFAFWKWESGPGARLAHEKFTPATGPVIDLKDVKVLDAIDAEYTKLVQSVVPSVVAVATARRIRVQVMDPLDYFFGRRRMAEQTQSALGSGVIVSREGHILTNNHVVANMEQIRVQLTDGRTFPAELVGTDEAVDIAVLKVKADNLAPLLLGDSDQVRVGQMVFAVGNPFGLQETVTRGIVSARGRALRDSGVEFLQTDAAVNPGNSGGPLLNLRGEIIGINSAIFSQTGGWAGISFAIPSNVAKHTLNSILQTGRPVRGYLGVNTMPLNRVLAEQFGIPDGKGALVTDVTPGSPAERSGIRPGDVIRSFNGRTIPDATAMRDLIRQAGIGTKVVLGIVRDGAPLSVSTETSEVPPGQAMAPREAPRPGDS